MCGSPFARTVAMRQTGAAPMKSLAAGESGSSNLRQVLGEVLEDVADADDSSRRAALQQRDVTKAADRHLVDGNGHVIVVAEEDGIGGHDLTAGDGVEVLVGACDFVQDVPRRDG